MSGHSQVRDGSRGAGNSARVGGGLKERPSLLTCVQVTDASLWRPHSEISNISAFLWLPDDRFRHMNG